MRPVLFTSVPKCGTHLLRKYFDASGFQFAGPHGTRGWEDRLVDVIGTLEPGQYASWHYHWTPELSALVAERDIRVVCLYRDPRAQVVSNLHWILKTPAHAWHRYLADHLSLRDDRLVALIQGVSAGDVARYFDAGVRFHDSRSAYGPRSDRRDGVVSVFGIFLGWLDDRQCLSLRFEDVIGARGGGERSRQIDALQKLHEHTGLGTLPGRRAELLGHALFDADALTFRSGQVQDWQREFSPGVRELFAAEANGLLDVLGYPRDVQGRAA